MSKEDLEYVKASFGHFLAVCAELLGAGVELNEHLYRLGHSITENILRMLAYHKAYDKGLKALQLCKIRIGNLPHVSLLFARFCLHYHLLGGVFMALAERVEHGEVDEGRLVPEYDLEICSFPSLTGSDMQKTDRRRKRSQNNAQMAEWRSVA